MDQTGCAGDAAANTNLRVAVFGGESSGGEQLTTYVMAALEAAIHFEILHGGNVDGRVKPGNDRLCQMDDSIHSLIFDFGSAPTLVAATWP